MGFMGYCISEGWQSQGSWRSEGRESLEAKSYSKGQKRNNDVPPHENTHQHYCLHHVIHFSQLYVQTTAVEEKPKNKASQIFIILAEIP